MPTSLISSFCTSGQMFAAGFLQIPLRNGHPCPWLYTSRYRACYGLAPIRECSCWANHKSRPTFTVRRLSFSIAIKILIQPSQVLQLQVYLLPEQQLPLQQFQQQEQPLPWRQISWNDACAFSSQRSWPCSHRNQPIR